MNFEPITLLNFEIFKIHLSKIWNS